MKGYFKCQFDETSVVKSREVGQIFKTLANKYKCEFIDVNEFVKPSDTDGLHYDETSHGIIATKLEHFIMNCAF